MVAFPVKRAPAVQPPEAITNYWSLETGPLMSALGAAPEGLSATQAAAHLSRYGLNTMDDEQQNSGLRLAVRQFESPLVLILIFAAVVSLVLRQWVDATIILLIVLGSATLSFSQEYRASNALEGLKRRLALTAPVLRDGVKTMIAVDEIVPGDIVILSAGNLIPADGLVITAQDFLVSQSALTGESFPVEKRAGVVAANAPIAARTNSVFLGASVQSGVAQILVTRTGQQTEFGGIAAKLRSAPIETDFARGVRQFGTLLLRVMLVIVTFVLIANLMLGRPVTDSLLFAAALAVGITPELLPAIIAVTLSAGARKMNTRGVIVRQLDAIVNLGSMNVLCTDKTGTLTNGIMTLTAALDTGDQASDAVLMFGYLNAAFQTGIANPLDAALVTAGEKATLTTSAYTKIDEIPYDFVRRRLTVVVAATASPGEHVILMKGAFANILEVCTKQDVNGVEVTLNAAGRADLTAIFETKGRDGLRVLAVAKNQVKAKADYDHADESDMVFCGFLTFSDPPKQDAAKIMAELKRLGISVKVISGDNRHVTAHIAAAVGIDTATMLTGEALNQLDDAALQNLAPKTALYSEIDPQQKERIVRALQHGGNVVGYMGDGINDAPSLRAADVGISVEGAVDVARASADIILLKNDFAVLCAGVEDGRRTFVNTLKYINIVTSSNFGNMISMALAAPFLPFLPLLAKQILLNNFLSDLPSLAISGDSVDPDRVTIPQRWNVADIRRFMVVFGLISSVFDLVTFTLLLKVFHAGESTFQTSWFVISLMTELLAVLVLRTRLPAWKSRPSALLLGSALAIFCAALLLPYLGKFSGLFGFVPLSFAEMVTALGIVVCYVLTTELAKRWYF